MRVSSTVLMLGLASVAAFSVTACAAHLGQEGPFVRQASAEVSRFGSASNVITSSELIEAKAQTTADGVRRLRPEFFRPTAIATPTGPSWASPSVYVNDVYAGGIEALEVIPLYAVDEIRFVRSVQGRAWWGPRCLCDGGVIVVRTK